MSTTRELNKALLVIDGPDQGDWRAWPKDSFVSVTVWATKRISEQPPPVTYRLGHHARQGLVWATEVVSIVTHAVEIHIVERGKTADDELVSLTVACILRNARHIFQRILQGGDVPVLYQFGCTDEGQAKR